MNYFAHGRPHLDRPYFLAGTAVPDWLNVCDRRSRVRRNSALACRDAPDEPTAQLAAGIVQHLDDDRWFHTTPAFFDTTARLSQIVRRHVDDDPEARPGFVGHILTEMLLDATLIQRDPHMLDAYYSALGTVDAAQIQQSVNRMARVPAERLEKLVELFVREEFLRCYLDDARLAYRLNQVMRRVGLPLLPDALRRSLPEMRRCVDQRAEGLLTKQKPAGSMQA